MKLVLASKNAHKLVEMRDILSQLGVEVVLESEVGRRCGRGGDRRHL